MADSTSTESDNLGNSLTPRRTAHHGEQESGDQRTSGNDGVPAVAAHEQETVTDDHDTSFTEWNSLSWWQKPIQTVKFTGSYLRMLVLFGLLIAISSSDKEKEERKRREQDQQSLLPAVTSNADPPPLPNTPASSSSPSNSVTGLTNIGLATLHHVYGALLRYAPQISYALCLFAIVKFGAPPQQNQQICVARQNGNGFIGNSDIYGLGIRLGIYIQWICVTFAVKFVPSARRYIISGYLFYQIGMVVAMCLLFSPGTCTFAAEVAIVLQFLWGGIAIALVPSVNKKTKYNPKSEYLGIDTLTAILGFLIFVFSSWLYLRRWSRGEEDFTAAPCDGTASFWLGPVLPGNTISFGKAQVVWIVIRTNDLFEVFQGQPKHLQFSSLLDWSWWFSATMTTGTLANLLHGCVTAGLYFVHANQALLTGFKDEPVDKAQYRGIVWLICFVFQGYNDVVAKW